jgi:hypothetical protein
MQSASSFMNDPEHWRERAEKARKTAETMMDPLSKETMLGIAKDYEGLAKRAAERVKRSQQSK